MKYNAILFDLDGVLVDACDWHYLALNDALINKGYLPISQEDHKHKFNGLPTNVKLKMMNIAESDISEINNIKQQFTLEIIEKNAAIMPEKIELHSWLKEQGFTIGCVTNSIRKTAEEMLKRTGQYDFMDFLISNEDVFRNKPFPDPYNFAINKFELDPEQTVCVEDSEKGIQSVLSSKIINLIIVKNTEEVNLQNIRNRMQ